MSIDKAGKLAKIDQANTKGLTGSNNSLAYRSNEIERHFHVYERWFGTALVPNAQIHVADRIGKSESGGSETPFTIDAGNDDWGNWLQILGSSDTPVASGNTYFDLHRLVVTYVEAANSNYYIQIGAGDSGAAALAAGTYTEIVYRALAAQQTEIPVSFMMRRVAVGTKVWARCMVATQNGAELSFFPALHEYEG